MPNIYAVIVTYNPLDLEGLKSLVFSLTRQDVKCVIVDNSDRIDIGEIKECCTILSNGKNIGIAAAQNIGIRHCVESGAEKIIFFDQDSLVADDFISNLLQGVSLDAQIVAPVFYDRQKGFGYKLVDINKYGFRKKIRPEEISNCIDVSVAISSGMMVNSEVFSIVGLMDERLFIDYVDTEWCLRCFREGIKVRINPAAKMVHSIGENSIKFLGFDIPVHSPIRRYYRVRNSIALIRYKNVPLALAFREIIFSFLHQAIIIASCSNKFDYVYYYCKGFMHGVLGVYGKLK